MFYYGFILLCVIIISVIDTLAVAPLFALSWWYFPVFVVVSVVAVVLVDALFAFISRWILPKKWFNSPAKFFAAGKKEMRFYEKLGIKKWKDRIPELGFLTAFRKNKIFDPKNNEYVLRYIMEANYGVVVHITGIVFGFLIILVLPKFWYCVGLPVAVVNVFYNFLSLMILRYNLPKLHTLYKYNSKKNAQA